MATTLRARYDGPVMQRVPSPCAIVVVDELGGLCAMDVPFGSADPMSKGQGTA